MRFVNKLLGIPMFLLLFITAHAQEAAPLIFNQTDSTCLYHSLLDAYKFHLSGILALKKVGEGYRIIFSTETGSTIFDFSISHGKCQSNYILKSAKNPLFIGLVKSDLLDLVQQYRKKKRYEKFVKEEYSVTKSIEHNKPSKQAEITSKEWLLTFMNRGKIQKTIQYTSVVGYENSESSIVISHLTMPVKIEMKSFRNLSE